MKLVSKVTEIYCIADDFCKEYELELNKKALSLSNPSPNIIETINDMLKNVAQIVHTRHRSISNFIVNLLAGIALMLSTTQNPLSIWSLRWREKQK